MRSESDFVQVFGDLVRKDGDLITATVGGSIALAGQYLEKKYLEKKYLEKKYLGGAQQRETPVAPPKPSTESTVQPEARKNGGEEKRKPLAMNTGQEIQEKHRRTALLLPAPWTQFLGEVTPGFKMLVWGLPGSGKSTFVLKLLDALNEHSSSLYVSAEEPPGSETLHKRIKRVMDRPKKTLFIDRLPETLAEWEAVAMDTEHEIVRQVIAVDSLTELAMTPDQYDKQIDELIDSEKKNPHGKWTSILLLCVMKSAIQVWITQAQKDGRSYRGESKWAHNADIVVHVEHGVARTTKNRFQKSDNTFGIY